MENALVQFPFLASLEIQARASRPRRPALVENPSTGCLEWQGAANSQGYGIRGPRGRQTTAHRSIFTLVYGPIPSGHHVCRNPICANPLHLTLLKQEDHCRLHVRKVQPKEYPKVREMAKQGLTHREIARVYGISRSRATEIINGSNLGPKHQRSGPNNRK